MQITDITLFLLSYCMLHGNIFTFFNALPIKETANLDTMSNRILCNSNSLKDAYLNAQNITWLFNNAGDGEGVIDPALLYYSFY